MNLLSSLLKYTADQIAALRAKNTSQDDTVSGINTRLGTAETKVTNMEAQLATAISAVTVDSEVQNIRVGDDNVTYTSAGEAVRTQFSNVKSAINYIIGSCGEEPLSFIDISGTTNGITIAYDATKRAYSFSGTASARTEVVLTKSFDLSAGNYVFDTGASAVGTGFNIRLATSGLGNITGSEGRLPLALTSNQSGCAIRVIIVSGSTVNVTITPTILNGEALLVRQEQFVETVGSETEASYVSGKYLNAGGAEADASGNTLGVLNNITPNSKIVYSGCGYFSEVCGYYSDGTVVKLIDSGSSIVYENEEIIISDPKIVTIKAWSINASATLSLKFAGLGKRASVLEKKVVTKYPKQKIGYIGNNGQVNSQSSGTNRYVEIANVEQGDKFAYTGRYYRNTNWGVVYGYYSDNTAINLLDSGLYENELITITDSNIKTVRAWGDTSLHEFAFYRIDELESVGKYSFEKVNQLDNNIKVVVDINGNGDFTDINNALTYIKQRFNVNSTPVELYIRNGVYEVSPTATGNYYAIDKGANKISIRGENRDQTIIRCTCTSALQGIALNIGGECTVENLTIENLADASYTPQTILTDGEHRPYCIHNDEAASDQSHKYYTTVKNCKLYSECSCPLGAGMHHNQVQRYENVEFVYANNAVIQQQGALYLHGPNLSGAVPIGAEIVDCVVISHNTRPAISMGNVSGMVTWAEMSATFDRNVTYSAGANEVSLASGMNITPYSKGNTSPVLNQ